MTRELNGTTTWAVHSTVYLGKQSLHPYPTWKKCESDQRQVWEGTGWSPVFFGWLVGTKKNIFILENFENK